ncbi:MAG: nicotinate-nucleotide--dimethylbenzimidazole phosphoribosyltransferase [Pelosinus sp.]|nr:nicotinate-nucleotide--dimethylbenzimidazole phosphoribosyltransferase [Pelosinus sp.]
MSLLEEIVRQISLPDRKVADKVRAQFDTRLGRLGEMVARYAGIRNSILPEVPHNLVVITSADHGVAKRGISAYPIETTLHMTANYLTSRGGTANAFANYCKADLIVVDMGVAGDLSHIPGLWHKKIAYGTNDFTKGPAMSRAQAVAAVETGIEIVRQKVKEGYNSFSLGEMGIGNTTSSAAIACVFTGLTPQLATGRGTGISDSRMQVKINVVREALLRNTPDSKDGLDVLSKVGGFELGALAGIIIGAAKENCAVMLDGLNTTAAALIAYAICPKTKEYLFASHLSGEPAHKAALQILGLTPCVYMGIRLGEAIGASVVVDMLTASVKLLHKNQTKAGVLYD